MLGGGQVGWTSAAASLSELVPIFLCVWLSLAVCQCLTVSVCLTVWLSVWLLFQAVAVCLSVSVSTAGGCLINLPLPHAPAAGALTDAHPTTTTTSTPFQAVKDNKIMLFMKGTPEAPQCGFSMQVVRILHAQGVDFASANVLEHPGIREGIKEYSSWPTIPQLYINGEFVGGCDIVTTMHQNGDLEDMLKE